MLESRAERQVNYLGLQLDAPYSLGGFAARAASATSPAMPYVRIGDLLLAGRWVGCGEAGVQCSQVSQAIDKLAKYKGLKPEGQSKAQRQRPAQGEASSKSGFW